MPGRPPSSYAYPKLWIHVEELDLMRSSKAIKRLKWKVPADQIINYRTRLTNRVIEKKLSPENPQLLEYDTAHDLHALISFHRRAMGLPVDRPADNIVKFDHEVCGLNNLRNGHLSEHSDPFEEVAIKSGLSSDVIYEASRGRLLPPSVCNTILMAADGRPGVSVMQRKVGRDGTPPSDSEVLMNIMAKLES